MNNVTTENNKQEVKLNLASHSYTTSNTTKNKNGGY